MAKTQKPKARNPFSRPVLDGHLEVISCLLVFFLLSSLCFLKVSMNESL